MQVLPRDEKFFELLVDHAKSRSMLPACWPEGWASGAGQSGQIARQIRDLEIQGDDVAARLEPPAA